MGGHDQYISAAIEQAKKSPMGFQLGAVIVFKGNIVARGHNRYISSCSYNRRISIHAEVDAISKCPPQYLYGATLYVVRYYNGRLLLAKPCIGCTRRIERTPLGGVYYTNMYSTVPTEHLVVGGDSEGGDNC